MDPYAATQKRIYINGFNSYKSLICNDGEFIIRFCSLQYSVKFCKINEIGEKLGTKTV